MIITHLFTSDFFPGFPIMIFWSRFIACPLSFTIISLTSYLSNIFLSIFYRIFIFSSYFIQHLWNLFLILLYTLFPLFPLAGLPSIVPLLLATSIYFGSRVVPKPLLINNKWFILLILLILFLTYSIFLNPLRPFIQAAYPFLVLPIAFILRDYFNNIFNFLRLLFSVCLSFVLGQVFLISIPFYFLGVSTLAIHTCLIVILLFVILVTSFSLYSTVTQYSPFFYIFLISVCILVLVSGHCPLYYLLYFLCLKSILFFWFFCSNILIFSPFHYIPLYFCLPEL